MKPKRIKVLIAILIISSLTFLVFSGVYYIRKNTHFLNFNPSKNEIAKNNQNFEEGMIMQDLIVPEQYRIGEFKNTHTLYLQEDFQISVYASGLSAPRHFDFDQENNLYVADKEEGKIFYLPDLNDDGAADRIEEFDSGLQTPHGIDYYDGDLYVAEEHQVIVYRAITEKGKFFSKEVLIKNLPEGVGHSTRTIQIGPDGKIYLTVGSSCNVCEEEDKRRAAMLRYNLDGSGEEIYAEGLRNTVDFEFDPSRPSSDPEPAFKIWSVDNGRDLIGDDIPPDEVNLIVKDKNYGWPYCYGNKIANPEYRNMENFCLTETQSPIVEMQSHSAPLGIALVPEEFKFQKITFPEELRNDLFITFHGSWNRSEPTGYKVVRIDKDSDSKEVIDFVTGWLDSDGNIWGRPVGIGFDLNGEMFISDDSAGAIYKISYKK